MHDETPWKQVNLTFPGDTSQEREQQALAHLDRVIPTVETAGLISAWWYIRKGPWRLRYLPTDKPRPVRELLTDGAAWTNDIYEPETHAFGGDDAMNAAHALFHHDSQHLLGYLTTSPTDRRERSIILFTALMRAAGLDLNEQGDVWARVLQQRDLHAKHLPAPEIWRRYTTDMRILLVGTPRDAGSWHTKFAEAGQQLAALRDAGRLTRGLRAVIALHVIFHWNRLGLPATSQALIARAAKKAIFDLPEAAEPPPQTSQKVGSKAQKGYFGHSEVS